MDRYEEVGSLRDAYQGRPGYEIGEFSYGGLSIYSWDEKTKITIGKFCSFAFGCTAVLGGEHRHDWVTTYPFTALWNDAPNIHGHPASKGDITIGNDVWIGAESMILSGAKIGDGAVIGARSVVTGLVPPYTVHAGHPSRFIAHRFPEVQRERLLALKWWDWPRERVLKALPMMLNSKIENFLEAAEAGHL